MAGASLSLILELISIPLCFKTEGGCAHSGCTKEAFSQLLRQQQGWAASHSHATTTGLLFVLFYFVLEIKQRTKASL